MNAWQAVKDWFTRIISWHKYPLVLSAVICTRGANAAFISHVGLLSTIGPKSPQIFHPVYEASRYV